MSSSDRDDASGKGSSVLGQASQQFEWRSRSLRRPLGNLALWRMKWYGVRGPRRQGASGGGTRGKKELCAHHGSTSRYTRLLLSPHLSLPKDLKAALPRLPSPYWLLQQPPENRLGITESTPLSLHYSPTKLPITSLLMTPYLMLYRLYLLSWQSGYLILCTSCTKTTSTLAR